jgi:hypothetical protein
VTAIFSIALLLALPAPTWAYLDPGTGSIFLQMLMAAVFGSLFFLKHVWAKALSFFQRLLPRKSRHE